MSRLSTLVSLLLLLAIPAFGQRPAFNNDSTVFVNTVWNVDTLDGFILRQCHFMHRQVFNSNQCISIIEIPKGSKAHLAFAADTVLTTTSAFAQRHHAAAAINGSYFNMSTGAPVCYLRVAGRELGENTPSPQDSVNRKYYQNATIRLLSSGRPVFVIPDSSRRAEVQMKDSNIMTAGPMLIHRGQVTPQRMDRRFVYARHNRTALGRRKDGTILLLVADGRCRGVAEGLSIPELTDVMRWLGCTEACNLDGGGSTTMYVEGRGEGGIVNHPSDNARFDAAGQRRVANAILVVRE